MPMNLSLGLSIGSGGQVQTSAVYDSGVIAATTAKQTSAVPNGLYSCLLQGGTGGTVWQYVCVTFGLANISNWSSPSSTFTRVRLYGPHGVTASVSGIYGPNARYIGLFGASRAWEVGSQYTYRYGIEATLSSPTTGANISPTHQGFCGGDPNYWYSIDTGTGGGGVGIIKRERDASWTAVSGYSNTTGTKHNGPGPYYTGGITSSGTTYNQVLIIPVEIYGGSFGTSSAFELKIVDVTTSGLPYVKSVNVSLDTATDEMSGAATDGTTVFISDFHRNAVHRVLIADINSASNGGTVTPLSSWTYNASFVSAQGITYRNGLLYLSCQKKSGWTSTYCILILDATTGAFRGSYALSGLSAGGREGCDFDVVSGKLGVHMDNTSGASSAVVNFFDVPSDPAYSTAGLNMNSTFGISFPGVKLDGVVSAFGVEMPASFAPISSLKQQSLNHFKDLSLAVQKESTSQMAGRVNGGTGHALPTATWSSGRVAWGFNWDNASVANQYFWPGNSDSASVAANWATGAPAAPAAWDVDDYAAYAGNHQAGRSAGTLGLLAIFGGRNFTQSEFDSLRNNPALLFDATDPLTAGQKAAYEAS